MKTPFKMKGFSGFGNSPVKNVLIKNLVKKGAKFIKDTYQKYKGTAIDENLKATTGYSRKVDLDAANARLRANNNRR
tara:strand:- start:622 stop:852 length:231 start_codon:yes stop_codon:yes gene_type:complete